MGIRPKFKDQIKVQFQREQKYSFAPKGKNESCGFIPISARVGTSIVAEWRLPVATIIEDDF